MSTLKTIKAIIANRFDIPLDTIKNASTIHGDLNLDSVDTISLISAIEFEFGIKINQENDLPSIDTVRDLAELIDKLSKQPS